MVNSIRSPSSSASCSWNLLLVSVGAILIVVMTMDIYMRVLSPPAESNSIAMSKKMPKLFPAGGHSIPPHGDHSDNTVGSVFRVIEILEDLGPVGDEAWDTLLFPKKGGYVYVKTNDSSAEPEPWGVAMFHGLHCLMMLRAAMKERQGTMQGMHDHGHGDGLSPDLDALTPTHLKHCLSYIAQVGWQLSNMTSFFFFFFSLYKEHATTWLTTRATPEPPLRSRRNTGTSPYHVRWQWPCY